MAFTWADPDLDSRPGMPFWLLPICIGSSFGALMLPPAPARIYVTLPVLLGAMALLPLYSTGMIVADYESMIVVLILLFKSVDLMVLSKPEEEFRRVPRKLRDDDRRVEEEGKPEDLLCRAKWSAALFVNFRGVGWNWKVRNVPGNQLATLSKGQFLKEVAFRALFPLLGAIYISSIELSTDYYSSAKTYPDIYQDFYARRTLVNYASALVLVMGMQATYWNIAFITTLCGLTSPEYWPDLMGRPAEAYTVRRMWGVAYHQTFRRTFTLAGNTVTRILGIAPTSLAARIIHLFTGFLVSAALHHAAGVMIGQGSMGSYTFFLSQAVAIIAEDVVMTLFAYLGYKLNRTTRIFGYAWVLLWFSVSLTPFTAGQISSGYGRAVAMHSNCGLDGFLPASMVVVPGAANSLGALLSAILYRGVFYTAAVALLSVVRRLVIPGKPLLGISLLGF